MNRYERTTINNNKEMLYRKSLIEMNDLELSIPKFFYPFHLEICLIGITLGIFIVWLFFGILLIYYIGL